MHTCVVQPVDLVTESFSIMIGFDRERRLEMHRAQATCDAIERLIKAMPQLTEEGLTEASKIRADADGQQSTIAMQWQNIPEVEA